MSDVISNGEFPELGEAKDAPIVGNGANPLETEAAKTNGHDPDPLPASDAPMVEFAVWYARCGKPVFPCMPSNKAPYIKGGLNAATTDEKLIRNWWKRWPQAMIAMPMGSWSGLWAIDPDPPKKENEHDGREVWAELLEEHGEIPPTHTETTPRGGWHILFEWDPTRPVTNSPGQLTGSNIDVRGQGGYVIMAPSICVGDGKKNVAGRYCVASNFFQFAMAPDWLYELVLTEPEPEPAPEPQPAPQSSKRNDDGKAFWRNVNNRAFQNLGVWVSDLFPRAEYQQGTGAYRISSDALGRDLDEDLSIHPFGAKDWGIWDLGDPRRGRRSAIDIVVQYGGKRDPASAALWLCDRMGIDPTSIGWRAKAAVAFSVVRDAEELDGTITQDGIAQVFAHRFKDQLRHCHHTGAWYEWTGVYWQKDEKAAAFQFCRELGREFSEDTGKCELKEVRKVSFAGGVEKFAKSDPALAVTSAVWDQDPFLLGTPGGTVDLHTGELREPDPRDGITKITAVTPAEKADCPLWLKFLGETFGNNAKLIRFIQQWNGYCLTGDIREHALIFGYGGGGNGKGVWLNTTAGIMKDYATTAAMETFVASKFDRHPTELAMLRGARMVTASETEEGRQWAESRIKQLTGGDPITARFMAKDFFTFPPAFKLTIIGNHKPSLRNLDDAIRRRFNLVPFNHKPAMVDKQLEQKLKAEWPGILRWMINGCLDWQKNGLVQPAIVVQATKDYFEDQDLMSQWLAEVCDVDHANKYRYEAIGVLFASWSDYVTHAGERPGSKKSFSNEMVKRGFVRTEAGHAKIKCFEGIKLIMPFASKDEEQ